MSLRDRQISGIPLSKGQAVLVTFFCAFVVIPFMWFFVWSKLLWFISRDLDWIVVFGAACMYLIDCVERVPVNRERALLWNGAHTGVSFSAGLCFVPKLPFPLLTFLFNILFSKNIANYIGWLLEGDVHLKSISLSCNGEGFTHDGVRIAFTFDAVLEVENAAMYLAQTVDDESRYSYLASVSSDILKQVKKRIKGTLVKDFLQGDHGQLFEEWVTQNSDSFKQYGLSIRTLVGVSAKIQNPEIEHAFDLVNGNAFLQDAARMSGQSFATFFAELKKQNPDIDETTASIIYLTSRGRSLQELNVFNVLGRK